ncbi:interleukin-12 subunit alpha-like [Anguilla rostrata]|uniref:interleukin-12 subunit alpha-like n=1 Tax=Anguilla rostrata TaxID=7938 RepID=UPI0030D25478
MQQNGKLRFAQWLLVVVLSWHVFDVSVGHPVKGDVRLDSVDMESCVPHARALLWNMTEVLQHDNLFGGINCTEQTAEMNSGTQTESACEPNPRQDASCRGQRNTKFDKTECLKNIERDTQYYRSALLAYSDRSLGSRLVKTIDDFTEHCFPAREDSSVIEVSPATGNTFEGRLKLCKAMKGLRVRAITINRVMSYIAAGDYEM